MANQQTSQDAGSNDKSNDKSNEKSNEKSNSKSKRGVSVGMRTLQKNPMMAHLADALDAGHDLGHYGRLTFAMVARHFLEPDELAEQLAKAKGFDEQQARGLVEQVSEADYNPPGPGKIRQWQEQQEFPIIPPGHAAGADANVYQDLKFPDHVYERIGEYYEERAEAKAEAE